MNRIAVELASTSPIVHNCCQVRYESLGWVPKDDREQAESRLFKLSSSFLFLPPQHPVVAIGRAARSRWMFGAKWPTSIVAAQRCTSLKLPCGAEFKGEWVPQVFRRENLPDVALPRFDEWSASFVLAYDPHYHQEAVLRSLLEHSGKHLGLPQFAPFAGRGPWGRFEVKTWEPIRVERLREAAVRGG